MVVEGSAGEVEVLNGVPLLVALEVFGDELEQLDWEAGKGGRRSRGIGAFRLVVLCRRHCAAVVRSFLTVLSVLALSSYSGESRLTLN